jgi:hypothetical protein
LNAEEDRNAMTSRKWLIPAAGLAAAVAGVVIAAAAFAPGSSQSSGSGNRPLDESRGLPESGLAAGCVPEYAYCDDVIEEPGGDEPISNPDELVSNPGEPISGGPGEVFDPTCPECEEKAAELAVNDLAERLGVDRGSIAVASVEAVEWSDACLGIQAPDLFCAQVITPGFRVTLTAGGETYFYHTDRGNSAVLVE